MVEAADSVEKQFLCYPLFSFSFSSHFFPFVRSDLRVLGCQCSHLVPGGDVLRCAADVCVCIGLRGEEVKPVKTVLVSCALIQL